MQMKTTSLTPDRSVATSAGSHESPSLFAPLRNAVHALYSRLNQMGTAIALGEAGDLNGAHAWREQHGTK
jgi:hypothetical protein